jgi:dienelactone hydrolase
VKALARFGTLAVGAMAFATAALCAPPLAESVLRVPVRSSDSPFFHTDMIEVTVYRPAGDGPFPIAVLSHGSPRTASDRKRGGRVRFESQARAFTAMGFLVVVPTRRGYGDSEGEWAEGYGSCSSPDYYTAGLESARDIAAAVAAAKALPGADAGRVLLVGQSAGGWGSVATSTLSIAGVRGVVNFAGGRGSQGPDTVCNEGELVRAAGRYGKAAKVPHLWIYSANDHYFAPPLVRRMHEAFVAGGAKAELLEVPPYRTDGHLYFSNVAAWTSAVNAFAARTGLVDAARIPAKES